MSTTNASDFRENLPQNIRNAIEEADAFVDGLTSEEILREVSNSKHDIEELTKIILDEDRKRKDIPSAG